MTLILAAVFTLLQVGDALSTIRALSHGGYEKTKLVKFLMDKLGVIPALAVKVLISSILGFGIALLSPSPFSYLLLGGLIFYFAYIVYNNLRV